MSTPTIVGTFANNTGSTGGDQDPTATLPGSLADGDEAYVVVGYNQAAGVTASTPTGWTLVGNDAVTSNNLNVYLFRKVLTAAESGGTVTSHLTSTSRWFVGGIVVRGGDFEAATTVLTDSSTTSTIDFAGFTPSHDDDLVVAIAGFRTQGNPATINPAAGYTEQLENNTTASGAVRWGSYIMTKALTGQSGTPQSGPSATYTSTTARDVSWVITVSPTSVPTASGGSSVDVAVTVAGSGVKVATGGSTVDVAVSTAGTGEKLSTGGATVDVTVSTSGTGSKHATGGSTSTVDASTSGSGSKETTGGSSVDVGVSTAATGRKLTAGGSSVDVAVSVAGSGEKLGAGGSSVDVAVTTAGSGTNPGGAPQGGSSVDVTVSTSGTGSKRATGGSTATVGASTGGTGYKEASGGSDVAVSVSVTSGGLKSGTGGSTVDVTVTEAGSGVKAGAGGSAATVVVSVTGGGSNPGDRDRDVLVVARVTPHTYRAEISPHSTYAAKVAPRDELAAVVVPAPSANLETLWSAHVSTATRQIYIGTTEYLVVNVSANVDLGDQSVSISFDGSTFATASWVGATASTRRAARLLMNAANTPAAGEHPVYVKLDDGVEVPIILAGRVVVIDPTA